MDSVVKSKKRPRVKMDFCEEFQLCRGSVVRSTQNQLHVPACCNSLAWDSSSARHKGAEILGMSAQCAGISSSQRTSLAAPMPANPAVPAHRLGYCCPAISADSLLASCAAQEITQLIHSFLYLYC